MKTQFQKLFTLLVALTLSVGMWAVDWNSYEWIGNGSGNDNYTNCFKLGAESNEQMPTGRDNIQQPNWATAPGIYMWFPTDVDLTVTTGQTFDKKGAGIILHVSQFTAKETEVTVTFNGGSRTFVIYNKNGATSSGGGQGQGETPSTPAEPTEAATTPNHTQMMWIYQKGTHDATFQEWSSGCTFADHAYGKKVTTSQGWMGIDGYTDKDASAMTHFHADIWCAKNMSVNFVPIYLDPQENSQDKGVTKQLTGGQWNAIDIVKTDGNWAYIDNWSNIRQFKLDGISITDGGNVFYINNVCFFRDESVTPPVASTWDAEDLNIAKNAAVYISAKHSGDKTKVTDGVVDGNNVQLGVYAEHPTEWLVIDLGANCDIEKFSITTTGDRKDKKFAICTAAAQAIAPTFADGTDALDGVWKEEWIFDDEYSNTGVTTGIYAVDWKNVRYLKYKATERNHTDQYGTAICEFRVKCASIADSDAPENFTATVTKVTGTKITFSLKAEDAVSNTINYSIKDDEHGIDVSTSGASGNTVLYTISGLSVSTTYKFSIVAKDISNNETTPLAIQQATTAGPGTGAKWYGQAAGTATHCWLGDIGEGGAAVFDDFPYIIDYIATWQPAGSLKVDATLTCDAQFPKTNGWVFQVLDYTTNNGNPIYYDFSKQQDGTYSAVVEGPFETANVALNMKFRFAYNEGGDLPELPYTVGASNDPIVTTKTVSATVNDAAMGTAVVKKDGVVVTEAEIGSNVDFIAQENDGYLFLGWYKGSTMVSESKTYTVENIQSATTLQAKFRALNTIYCHTQLTNGDKSIYLTMKRTAENTYQVVIDSETEMQGFSNAYIGGVSGAAGEQIKLNDADVKAQYVTLSENNHRLTVNVTSTKAIKWNTPVYINMPGEVTFTEPNNKVIEYDVTCDEVAVSSVTLSQSAATVDVDGKVTLTASIAPIYADNQTITWTTSNESIVTVEKGVVTAGTTAGNATVTAAVGGLQATCAITVQLDQTVPHVAAPTVDATGKEFRSIYSDELTSALTNDNFGLNVYGNVQYTKKAIDGNNFFLCTVVEESKRVFSWGSSNGADKALLAKNGMSNPDDVGNKGLYAANMKYMHIDIWSSEAATEFKIQNDNTLITSVDLNGSGWQSFDIDITGKANDLKNISILKFTNLPTNTKVAIDNVYFWKSNGTVAVASVSLNKTETSINLGQSETLVATIAPIAASQNVTWSTSDADIATVDETGKVTPVSSGTVTITATSTEDGTKSASCAVTITAVTPKTFYGVISGTKENVPGVEGTADYTICYAATRNADYTITFTLYTSGSFFNATGLANGSVSCGGIWGGNDFVKNADGSRSKTISYDYTEKEGQQVECFFQFAYANSGLLQPFFNYVVGSEGAIALDQTKDNSAILAALNGHTADVTLNRGFAAGTSYWNTLCLPFSLSEEQCAEYFGEGYQLLYLHDAYMKSEEVMYLNFQPAYEVEAGKAYAFKPSVNVPADQKYSGVLIDNTVRPTETTLCTITGIFNPTVLTAGQYFLGTDSYLHESNTTNPLKAFRMYFTFNFPSGQSAPTRVRISFGPQVTTDLENLQGETEFGEPQKILLDGQVYILRAGHMYNLQGQLIQ